MQMMCSKNARLYWDPSCEGLRNRKLLGNPAISSITGHHRRCRLNTSERWFRRSSRASKWGGQAMCECGEQKRRVFANDTSHFVRLYRHQLDFAICPPELIIVLPSRGDDLCVPYSLLIKRVPWKPAYCFIIIMVFGYFMNMLATRESIIWSQQCVSFCTAFTKTGKFRLNKSGYIL